METGPPFRLISHWTTLANEVPTASLVATRARTNPPSDHEVNVQAVVGPVYPAEARQFMNIPEVMVPAGDASVATMAIGWRQVPHAGLGPGGPGLSV